MSTYGLARLGSWRIEPTRGASPAVRAGEQVILLARHGRTPENAEGRILGRRDPRLDPAGEGEADALAEALADQPFAAIWTSPLRRARATAAAVGNATGLSPLPLEDLIESDRGRWEGRLVRDLRDAEPQEFEAFVEGREDFAFPGGEALREQGLRTERAVAEIGRGPLPAMVVAHAGTIRATLLVAGLHLPPEADLAHGRIALKLARKSTVHLFARSIEPS